jgi:hypothetical protein
MQTFITLQRRQEFAIYLRQEGSLEQVRTALPSTQKRLFTPPSVNSGMIS